MIRPQLRLVPGVTEINTIGGYEKEFHITPDPAQLLAFGLTFDDYGNRFICNNRHPLQHVVIEERYLKLNPYAAIESVVQDVVAAEGDSRVYPLSRAWTTSNLHAGQFTAACGASISTLLVPGCLVIGLLYASCSRTFSGSSPSFSSSTQ